MQPSGSRRQLRRREAGWRAAGGKLFGPKQHYNAVELDSARYPVASLQGKSEARGDSHVVGVPQPWSSGDRQTESGAWSEQDGKVAWNKS
jgi:hypothetical protein